jgi:hypothetical protein
VFDIDGLKAVELVGVKIATIECEPGRRLSKGPTATPPTTGTGPPRLWVVSLNCTVPAALPGVTLAMGIAKPPNPRGSGTRITDSVVAVNLAPGAGVGDGDGLGLGDVLGLGLGDVLGLGLGDGLGVEVGAVQVIVTCPLPPLMVPVFVPEIRVAEVTVAAVNALPPPPPPPAPPPPPPGPPPPAAPPPPK